MSFKSFSLIFLALFSIFITGRGEGCGEPAYNISPFEDDFVAEDSKSFESFSRYSNYYTGIASPAGEVIGKSRFHPKRYNIYYSEEKEFVWFRVFKNASGEIKDRLSANVPDLVQIRPEKVPARLKKCFKFAFVRNIWSRVVSCYFHKVLTEEAEEFKECFGKGFGCFIKYIEKQDLHNANSHIKLQSVLIPVDQCDFIGRIENFEEDFRYVCDKIGIEPKNDELTQKHKTEHAHYSTYYEPWMVEVIARKYKEDIDAFGYKFETR